jgi:HipA-like C-terminal domain
VIDFSELFLDEAVEVATEPRGKKQKVWVTLGDDTWLFKQGREKTLENVTEVIAAYLAGLLQVRHAEYRLASRASKKGVASRQIGDKKSEGYTNGILLGNELMAPSVGLNGKNRPTYGNAGHTIEAILQALKSKQAAGAPPLFGEFIGFLLFDAWIANQDRHNENWGVLIDGGTYQLAPSFDHAAALGSSLKDSERNNRLNTKDRGYSIKAWCGKARSAIYGPGGGKTLLTHDAFRAAGVCDPVAYDLWLGRLSAVDMSSVAKAIQKCPAAVMSTAACDFTLAVLNENRNALLGL